MITVSEKFQSIIRAAGMVNWKHFAVSILLCPICDKKRPFVKLNAMIHSVRCLSCRATVITLSLVSVLRQISPKLNSKHVYELSSRGPLFRYLTQQCDKLTCSEYFSDIAPGDYKEGVQCQDVQRLTFQNESFDICTSTEVFEHVPNDTKGFSEIYRVLKPNGVFVFTVPLAIREKTVQRAELDREGNVKYLLPPEYHGDPIRPHERILAFRNYGFDILDKLLLAGFKQAELRKPRHNIAWDRGCPVIVAYRDIASNSSPDSDPLLLRCATSIGA